MSAPAATLPAEGALSAKGERTQTPAEAAAALPPLSDEQCYRVAALLASVPGEGVPR